MNLTVVGTRGFIEARTRQHLMHRSLLVSYYNQQIMVDCGEDWIRIFAEERGVKAKIAHDRLEIVVR